MPIAKHQEVLFIFDLVLFAGMETPQISHFSVSMRVELKETLFWSLSKVWELLAENRTTVLPQHARGRQMRSYRLLLVFPRDTPNI